MLCYKFGLLLLIARKVMSRFMKDFMPKCPSDNRVEAYSNYLLKNYIANISKYTIPLSYERKQLLH